LHSCWCILLFECGLNSNSDLNSNFVWIRNRKGEIERKPKTKTQNPTRSPPLSLVQPKTQLAAQHRPTLLSRSPLGPAQPAKAHFGPDSRVSPLSGPLRHSPARPSPAPSACQPGPARQPAPRVAALSPAPPDHPGPHGSSFPSAEQRNCGRGRDLRPQSPPGSRRTRPQIPGASYKPPRNPPYVHPTPQHRPNS